MQEIVKWVYGCLGLIVFFSTSAFAQNTSAPNAYVQSSSAQHTEINLTVAYKTVNFAGKSVKAIAVNDQIPGPILHFKQGDDVTINVYNHLNKGTTIHWHGLLVPWQMDGVEGVSQNPIPPGGVFHYQFTLKQSGTYWYHAHSGFQEQQGLHGTIIIDPPTPPTYAYDKDYVVLLSDWSNTAPEKIFANLKKDGDYYSPRMPLQPSLMKFLKDYRRAKTPQDRQTLLAAYKMMQRSRMSVYDISDIAYDAFLLNGHTPAHPWTAPVKVGDVVRLRFIGAAGSTIFQVKIPGAHMQMVHVEGNDVKPYFTDSFTIASGETYDVLIKITQDLPYVIYAESADTLGAAIGALVTAPDQVVNTKNIKPFPEPAPMSMMGSGMTMPGMKMPSTKTSDMDMSHMSMSSSKMSGMDMSHMTMSDSKMSGMDMSHMSMPDSKMSGTDMSHMTMSDSKMSNMKMPGMDMPTMPAASKMTMTAQRPMLTMGTKYQELSAAEQTNDPNKPIARVIKMELSGFMNRYIWYLNGKTEDEAAPIVIEPKKRYRVIFTNNTMMHHPMHIHGHWFILRNGHGAYDPLLHTIDVPPGATVTADFDANADGQWFFHCHHLYHMMAGMAQTFQYSTLIDMEKQKIPFSEINADLDPEYIARPMGMEPGLSFFNLLDVNADPFHNNQEVTYQGLWGGNVNKLQLYMNEAEVSKGAIEDADLDIFYWHMLSQFWAIKGGANYVIRPTKTPYVQPGAGFEGTMPYFIDTDFRSYYHGGSMKADLELSRDTQITNNFFIRADIRGIAATKTVRHDEVGSGMNEFQWTIRPFYQLSPAIQVYLQYENTHYYGVTKQLLQRNGDDTGGNTYSAGLAWIF
jgi:CopA family copper-resistance protein